MSEPPLGAIGEIILSQRFNEWTGRHETEVKAWRGGSLAYLSDYALMEWGYHPDSLLIGQRLTIGPYHVRVIKYDWLVWLVHRESLPGYVQMLRYRLSLWLREINVRVLLTLAIWGLANYKLQSREEITWKHVKLVRRLPFV